MEHNINTSEFCCVKEIVCFFLQCKEKYLLPLSLRHDTNLVEMKNHLLCEDVLQSNSVPTVYVPAASSVSAKSTHIHQRHPALLFHFHFLSLILTHA